ncbi:MAG TPA: metal ABC transporter permease [Calditerricola sp.]
MEGVFDGALVQRALLTGAMVGLLCPIMGLYLVARRLAAVGEVLAHVNLLGVAVGAMAGSAVPFLASLTPPAYGMLFAVLGAFAVLGLRRAYAQFAELTVPILLAVALGASVVLFRLMGGFGADLAGYLFGNLVAVQSADLQLVAVATAFVLGGVALLYKELFAVTFDAEHARVVGIPVRVVENAFIVMMALTISAAVRAVGVLLASGLMVVPVAAGLLLAGGFRRTLVAAIAISELSVMIGFFLAYGFQMATGGTIILVALFFLLVAAAFRHLRERGEAKGRRAWTSKRHWLA